MRDRLIELIKQAKKHTKDANTDIGRNMIFADHLIENGVIVPPCKVGDKVYCIYHNKVIQGTVSLIRPFISEKETIFKGNIICEVDNIFLDDGSKEVIELHKGKLLISSKLNEGTEIKIILPKEKVRRL